MCHLSTGRECDNTLIKEDVDMEKDIQQLKRNWVFLVFVYMVNSINYCCVMPTNHQFIINPTSEALNTTSKDIEPGLGQSEAFYSLTYMVLYFGYAASAVAVAILFNFIPTWYLFLASTLTFTLGYLLYALAVNGWMMLLARGLAGFSSGAVVSAVFAYYAVSYEKYTKDLKALGKYEEKKAAKMKGYVVSSYTIGYAIGNGIAIGFPAILAQFPDTPQFRTAGWFCVATGVALLLLQFILFNGESGWHDSAANCRKKRKKIHSFQQRKCTTLFCQVFIPLYIVVFGGLEEMCYIVPEVLLNPIVSDTFGFSEEQTTYILFILFVAPALGLILLYILQYFKFRGFGLTVIGMTSTIIALLLMTDWQAIGSDPCVDYSLFHHPQLADQYRVQLARTNVSDSGMVSVQSLHVVEDDVYQMAVNKCESAGDYCHWIPNSRVTHKHCNDCQPICRDSRHTLNFVQFVLGTVILFLMALITYTGIFLLLSGTVGKSYQGVSVGALVAANGVSRCVFPYLFDFMYELEGKRTYLPMLIQVAIYTPLLVGLILLYPWLAGRHQVMKQDKQSKDIAIENKDKMELIPTNGLSDN